MNDTISEAAREAADAILERCDFGSIALVRMRVVFERHIQHTIDAECAKAVAEACAPLVEALLIETQNHLPECACAACKALAAHRAAHGDTP